MKTILQLKSPKKQKFFKFQCSRMTCFEDKIFSPDLFKFFLCAYRGSILNSSLMNGDFADFDDFDNYGDFVDFDNFDTLTTLTTLVQIFFKRFTGSLGLHVIALESFLKN